MEIGIIGGTGPAGRAVAQRLATGWHNITLGSRDADRSAAAARELVARWPSLELKIEGGTNIEAAGCEIVILATPWEVSISSAVALKERLEGKILISMVNALERVGSEFEAITFARGSVASSLQAVLPRVAVVGAFHHLPAKELGALDAPFVAEVLSCSDSPTSFSTFSKMLDSVEGLRAVYCGSLAGANAIEALTATLLNVNVRYRSHVSLRLSGLKEGGESE